MAAGDTLLIFTPQANEPPAANYATLDSRNGHLVLDFDADTDESAVFKGVMPRHYGGGGVTVYLHYGMSTAVADGVVWTAAFERVSDSQQDIDADGFAAAQTITDTVPGTSGHVTIAAIAFTDGAQMDSIAAGEGFRLRLTRDANHATDDTATGDAELWAVELRETP